MARNNIWAGDDYIYRNADGRTSMTCTVHQQTEDDIDTEVKVWAIVLRNPKRNTQVCKDFLVDPEDKSMNLKKSKHKIT